MNKPLKVALVCHSDRLGGAAVVTYRLMQALRAAGVDARMVVFVKMSDPHDEEVIQMLPKWKRASKFVFERIPILLQNGFRRDKLFLVSTASTGMPLHRNEWIRQADVIHLNWFNQGLLSLSGIRSLHALGKPIVWTMHDMWAMTGICHHAYSCRRFEEKCGKCPQLNSRSNLDLSRRVWKKKWNLYADVPIRYVAVSSWLAEKCRQSSLLRDKQVEVIPNAFPVETFITEPMDNYPAFNPIKTRNRIIMGAARLDDPIKGLDIAIEALNLIFDEHPDIADNTGIIFFGDIRHPAILDTLRLSHIYMGRVADPTLLRQLYASSKVVLSASHFETLPGTLIEGQAAGALPVTFGQGGQADIITHLKDGYIAPERSARALADGILWALAQNPDRQALHESVARRFAASGIAARYIDLYRSLQS